MNKQNCNCPRCNYPTVQLIELEDRSIVGILYKTSGGIPIVGIGESDAPDADSEFKIKPTSRTKRRRRLKSAFRALKNAGRETAKLGLQSAIPAPDAINTLRRINRTRADLETLSQLGVNESAPVESINGIDKIAIDLYRGCK